MTPAERIMVWSIPEPNSGCWLWLGTIKKRGYGNMIIGSRRDKTRRSISSHRYSYTIFVGPLLEGLEICHRCDVPGCVNPDHLFQGTRQENVDDRERKNRNGSVVGEYNPNCLITETVAIEIMKLAAKGVKPRFIVAVTGVSRHIVKEISSGRRWRHLLDQEPPK